MEGQARAGQKEKDKRDPNAAGTELHIINCTAPQFFLVPANQSRQPSQTNFSF